MRIGGAMEKAAAGFHIPQVGAATLFATGGITARRAMIDPFGAVDCGNDCDTIASQPECHRLARIFGRPLPAAPPGLTVLNVGPSRLSSRSWSSFDGAQLS